MKIYSDDRSGLYSQPGDLLWEADFDFEGGGFTKRSYGEGDQGWYDPEGGYYIEHDHVGIYQVNITDIADPFIQQAGQIYWLSLNAHALFTTVGWKRSR